MINKQCSKCGEIKPVGDFYKKTSTRDGLQPICKACTVKWNKQYYVNHKEENSEHCQQYRVEHRDELLENGRKYYAEHKEELQKKARQYYSTHKEEKNIYNRQWVESHKSELAEYHAQYYINHQEEKREYMRQRRAEHPEYVEQYRINHREMLREKGRRRRARLAELPFDFYVEDEKFALNYWDNKCAICGKALGVNIEGNVIWAFDHWIAITDKREDNPGTVPWNMLPLCHGKGSCNGQKHNSDPIKWLYRKYSPEQADEILVRINKYFEIVKSKVSIEETDLGD